MKSKKVDLFLDSGAFSAKSQKVTIDIQDYIAFIKEHEDVIDVYANLDVIGDPAATWKNQMIMEEAGLSPLPVFHQGSPEKYLKRYIDRYEYVALGGMVGVANKLSEYLDRIFSTFICHPDGTPKVKVHGFGLTILKMMLRYPWYSVDSTSWVVTGRLGSIYTPQFKGGNWIYDENSWKVGVSSRSPSSPEGEIVTEDRASPADPDHIDHMSPLKQKVILDYLHDKGYRVGKSRFEFRSQSTPLKEGERWFGKKPKDKTALREVEIIEEPGLCNQYALRDEMNIIFFLDLEKSMPEWPWPFKLKSGGGLGI